MDISDNKQHCRERGIILSEAVFFLGMFVEEIDFMGGIFVGPNVTCLMLSVKSGLDYFKYIVSDECKHIHLK